MEALARPSTKAPSITGVAERRQLIVVIDPVRTALELINYALEQDGYQTLAFIRIDAAVQYLEAHSADLIVTEIASPWESETFDLAPLMEAAKETPILIYTRSPELVSKAIEHFDVVSRPSAVDVLLDRVARVISSG